MIKPLLQRILVAINGSEDSIRAAMYGILLAKQYKCALKAVYVVDTATLRQLTLSKFFISEESEAYETNMTDDGKRYLAYVAELAKSKGVKIETELLRGAVWSEVLKASDDFDASVILLGGRPHSHVVTGIVNKHDMASVTNAEIIGSSGRNIIVVKQADVEKLFKIA